MLGYLLNGRYKLTQKLAQDRWSHTYLAQDERGVGQIDYIVKQIQPEKSDSNSIQTTCDRANQQVERLKTLSSCDLLPQHVTFCQDDGNFYLIREFIEGRPLLDELLPGHPVSEQQAIALLAELLDLLEFLHYHQIVHGNIHPNNIIRRSKDKQLVLVDFNPIQQTIPKLPGYQPPEQSQGILTFSSDVYAVGLIIIQALTGIATQQLPRNSHHKIIWQNKTPVSRPLASILNKMVQSHPKHRYFSTTKALTEVKKLRQHPLKKSRHRVDTIKIVVGFVGLMVGFSAIAFLMVNESALFFILRPKLLLANLKQEEKPAFDLKLEIIEFNTNSRTPLLPNVAEKVEQIAVGITLRIEGNKKNYGSGVIIGRNGTRYYALTANHVLGQTSQRWVVTSDGDRHNVDDNSVKKFPGLDLALLEFNSENDYPVATLGNYELKKDRMPWVFLSGWRIASQGQSAKREFNAGNLFSQEFALLTITDEGSLNRGYELLYTNFSKAGVSGGPVLDSQGRAIGIHGASRVDRASKVQLGESLGVPIQKFLGLANLAGIPLESLTIETSPPSEVTGEKNLTSQIPDVFNLNPPARANDHRQWVNYGNQLWRMGLNNAAIAAFDRAVTIESDFYPAWYLRGLALKQEKKYSEALSSFDRAIKIQPKLYQVWRERGEIFAQLGDYPQALNSIARAIKLNDREFLFFWLRGNWLYQSQRYVKAIQAYDRAIEIDPHPFSYYNRGVARHYLKDYSGAIADYDTAINMGFESGKLYQSRALAYFARGDRPLAIQDFKKATELTCEISDERCQTLQETLKQGIR